jgi:hypothetical protein
VRRTPEERWSISSRRTSWLVAASLAFSLSAAAETSVDFSFAIPEGFIDITNLDGPPPLSPIDSSYFERANGFDRFAVKLADGKVVATYTVKVTKGVVPVTELRRAVTAAIAQSPQTQSLKVVSTSTPLVDGVKSGRLELEAEVDGSKFHQITFAMQGREHWAAVALAVYAEHPYAPLVPAFEAAVARTQGLSKSVPPTPEPTNQAKAGVFGVLLVSIGIGSYLLKRGRRRSTSWRASP